MKQHTLFIFLFIFFLGHMGFYGAMSDLVSDLVSDSMADSTADSMDDLMNQFGQAYESLKPEKNSSVNTDYKIEQTALGTFYSTKALNLIYDQNKELMSKYDQMAEKYNEIVEQNKEVIRLLTIISEKGIEFKKQENIPQ